jgi:tetratricopeptide (TPR) repeat protein
MTSSRLILAGLLTAAALVSPPASAAKEIARPEEIKSKRLVVYDGDTYARLASMWRQYNSTFPSEYSYANWMYAARYAADPQYEQLLEKGLRKYPANPTLLYLESLLHHGGRDNAEERKLLERAVALDPTAMDPWFSLVDVYMAAGEQERMDEALRRILASGIVLDAVMDYNYNVLAVLEPNAVLITNGDNDTYPAWILTRVLQVRPDVAIANRSLLNTDWYPLHLIDSGLPRFTDAAELAALRASIQEEMKGGESRPGPGGPFGDTLIVKIVEAARRAGRPVYFAGTLYPSEPLARFYAGGRDLGLVTLVTPSRKSYETQLADVCRTWLESFRTGGIDSWSLRQAPEADAGRMLAANYAAALARTLGPLRQAAPDVRAGLFRWYLRYVEPVLTSDTKGQAASAWCEQSDVPEIAAWCRQQGLKK